MNNLESKFMIDCHRYAELVVAEYQLSVIERTFREGDTLSFEIMAKAMFGKKESAADA